MKNGKKEMTTQTMGEGMGFVILTSKPGNPTKEGGINRPTKGETHK
jgi:hypothetical protein